MTDNANSEGVEPLTIDVVSDAVCPWCFVGKRRLDEALDGARSSLTPAFPRAASAAWIISTASSAPTAPTTCTRA